MQEVFEKIIEKLETVRLKREEQLRICHDSDAADYLRCKMSGLADAIEIVKQEAEKCNNGWIPCSERLPDENGYYYVTQIVKSISTGKKIAIEKTYVEFSGGKWKRAKHLEVIAWLDINPYQSKGE